MAKKTASSEGKSAEFAFEPKKRGTKKTTTENTPAVEEIAVQAEVQPEPTKKRGRPKKETVIEEIAVQAKVQPEPAKKRGRTNKEVVPVEEIAVQVEVQSEPVKKRGRPKKETAAEKSVAESATNEVLSPAGVISVENVKSSTSAELTLPFKFLDSVEVVRLHLDKGSLLYTAGDIAERVFFVQKGSMLIVEPDIDGQILSEIKAGEVCVFSAVSVLGNSCHRFTAILEATSDILAVPAEKFRLLLAFSAEARTFVFGSILEQMSAPLRLLEEISLHRSDIRLAKAISRYVTVENTICNRSVSDLAEDTLLSPEIVELLLKEFQRRGYLAFNNKTIVVTDRAALIRKSLE